MTTPRRSSTGSSRSDCIGEMLPAHVVAQEGPRHRGQRRGQAGRPRRHPERGRRGARADLGLLELAASTSPRCRTTPSWYLASGPYMISDFVADQYVTLTANPEYKGDNAANIEEITIRFIPDPLAAAQALENGEVDVISPQATADFKTALDAIDGATVITGSEGTYEHVDLQFENAKNPENIFKDPKVREAFLKTVPAPGDRRQAHRADRRRRRASLRSSQIFVPGCRGLRRVRREQRLRRLRRGRHRGCHGAARRVGRHQPRGLHPVRVEQPASCQRVRPDPGFGQPGRLQRHRLRLGRVGRPARHARRVRRGLSSDGSRRASASTDWTADVRDRRHQQPQLLLEPGDRRDRSRRSRRSSTRTSRSS